MPEIKEVIRRLYLSRAEFHERFPEVGIHPSAGIERLMVEEVYRLAALGEVSDACLVEAAVSDDAPWPEWPKHPLVLRGYRLASGRWLRKIDHTPTMSTSDAEQQAATGECPAADAAR